MATALFSIASRASPNQSAPATSATASRYFFRGQGGVRSKVLPSDCEIFVPPVSSFAAPTIISSTSEAIP